MISRNDIIVFIFNNHEIKSYFITVAGYNRWEDLRSELINQLYLMDFNKLLQAYHNDFLLYLCFTIASRIKKGKIADTGLFYKHGTLSMETDELVVMSGDEQYRELGQDYYTTNIEDEDNNIDEMYDKILQLIDEQHWYNKTLFKLYYIDGLKLREISEIYGINIKSIHYAIVKIKNEIKKQVKNDNNNFIWG